jgi:hypothetical protein
MGQLFKVRLFLVPKITHLIALAPGGSCRAEYSDLGIRAFRWNSFLPVIDMCNFVGGLCIPLHCKEHKQRRTWKDGRDGRAEETKGRKDGRKVKERRKVKGDKGDE